MVVITKIDNNPFFRVPFRKANFSYFVYCFHVCVFLFQTKGNDLLGFDFNIVPEFFLNLHYEMSLKVDIKIFF